MEDSRRTVLSFRASFSEKEKLAKLAKKKRTSVDALLRDAAEKAGLFGKGEGK